jgi:ribosomal protein L22
MAEDKKQTHELKHEAHHEAPKIEEKKPETKVEAKKIEVKKVKKNEVSVYGSNLHMGYKVGADICDMIRGRNVDEGIKRCEEVVAFKRAVMTNKREAPHKPGMMAGRYPVKACADFILLLKKVKANAIYHELELEKAVVYCKADKASQPFKRGGARTKRSNILLKLVKKPEVKAKIKIGEKKPEAKK